MQFIKINDKNTIIKILNLTNKTKVKNEIQYKE